MGDTSHAAYLGEQSETNGDPRRLLSGSNLGILLMNSK
jgi:hypothetical protein